MPIGRITNIHQSAIVIPTINLQSAIRDQQSAMGDWS
jgi:hypothetical protein